MSLPVNTPVPVRENLTEACVLAVRRGNDIGSRLAAPLHRVTLPWTAQANADVVAPGIVRFAVERRPVARNALKSNPCWGTSD